MYLLSVRKLVVVVCGALALVLVTAVPASADPGTITAWSFRITGTTGTTLVDASSTDSGTSCVNDLPAPTADGDITASNQVVVNSVSSQAWFEQFGNLYELDLSLAASTPGTYNAPYITDLGVILEGTIYSVTQDSNGTCTKGAAVCQGIGVPLLLHGTTDGEISGGVTTLSGGSAGSSLGHIVVTGTCAAPWAALGSGSVQIPDPGPPAGPPLTFVFD